MSAVILLQARMSSSRLPGKALASIDGRSILAHCVDRLRGAGAGDVIVATSSSPADRPIAEEAARLRVECFRGSELDVLDRMAACVARRSEPVVVRATADNPAVDGGGIARLLPLVQGEGFDHAVEADLPYGCAVEVMTRDALLRAAAEAAHPQDREHVTPYIRRAGGGFRCAVPRAPAALARPSLRFTVDTAADLSYMRAVFGASDHRRSPVSLRSLIAGADALAAHAARVWRKPA